MNAYITLISSYSQVPGALTLAHTLRSSGSRIPLAIIVDPESLPVQSVRVIRETFDHVIEIDSEALSEGTTPGNVGTTPGNVGTTTANVGQHNEVSGQGSFPRDGNLKVQLAKLQAWNQVQFEQLVYLEADTFPVKSIEHLFEQYQDQLVSEIVAAPDAEWPEIFNSAVMMIRPNSKVYQDLMALYKKSKPFDGSIRGLLNEYFHLERNGNAWKRLPFYYNVPVSSNRQYLTRFKAEILVMHYSGQIKPWSKGLNQQSAEDRLWWEKFTAVFPSECEQQKFLSLYATDSVTLKEPLSGANWDSAVTSHLDQLSLKPSRKLFPWEQRDERAPTRVFGD